MKGGSSHLALHVIARVRRHTRTQRVHTLLQSTTGGGSVSAEQLQRGGEGGRPSIPCIRDCTLSIPPPSPRPAQHQHQHQYRRECHWVKIRLDRNTGSKRRLGRQSACVLGERATEAGTLRPMPRVLGRRVGYGRCRHVEGDGTADARGRVSGQPHVSRSAMVICAASCDEIAANKKWPTVHKLYCIVECTRKV